MRLTKYKQHRHKLAKRHARSKRITDSKPLKTGGRLHVHNGRVHIGAGFEGKVLGVVGDMMDLFGSMGDKTRGVAMQVYR